MQRTLFQIVGAKVAFGQLCKPLRGRDTRRRALVAHSLERGLEQRVNVHALLGDRGRADRRGRRLVRALRAVAEGRARVVALVDRRVVVVAVAIVVAALVVDAQLGRAARRNGGGGRRRVLG